MHVLPEIDPMTRKELISKYFSALGKQSAKSRLKGLTKKEVSNKMRELSEKGIEKIIEKTL